MTTLTPDQANLVTSSFHDAIQTEPKLARKFYDVLFQIEPSVAPLFKGDIDAQADKLGSALSFVIQSLFSPDALAHPLTEMGRRHAGYGAEPRHYQIVGDALIATLKAALAERWTTAHADAWSTAYAAVAALMLKGAGQTAEEAAA